MPPPPILGSSDSVSDVGVASPRQEVLQFHAAFLCPVTGQKKKTCCPLTRPVTLSR